MGRAVTLARGVALLAALSPGVWIAWQWGSGALGPLPAERIVHLTGLTALTLLIAALVPGPAFRLVRQPWIIAPRRVLGVAAFAYAFVHAGTWAGWDFGFAWGLIVAEVAGRPYLWAGVAALALMAPLALTSTDAWVQRLGRSGWQRLHSLTYPTAILAILHYYWATRLDYRLVAAYALVVAALLLWRLGEWLLAQRGIERPR